MPEYTIELPSKAEHLLRAQQALQEALGAAAAGQPFAKHEAAAKAALAAAKAIPATDALALICPSSSLFGVLSEANIARKAGRLPGLSTGIGEIDRLLGGLRPGLALVGAIPGAGKTAFALNCAVASARAGKRVLYVTCDEPGERLAMKAACIAGGVEVGSFVDGWKHPQELLDSINGMDWLANIQFLEGYRLGLAELSAAAEGADLLVVDYLQPFAAGNSIGMEMRHAIDAVAAMLRDIATEQRIPVLALSSLNRNGYERPTLASLRESGGLEFCADVVALLHCDNPEADVRQIAFMLQKNRFGRAFIEEQLRFHPKKMAFDGNDAALYAVASGSSRRAKFT